MDAAPALGISLRGVTKAFGAQVALDHVDLEIPQGSFLAVMGANGAGKTTLLKTIAGLAVPTAGSVRIAGVEMREAGPRLRALIGVVSHETMLYADLTAAENLRFHARLFGLRHPREAVERAGERLGITPVLDRPVRALSRGTRQRVALARALLHDPAILLLDEPFTGLDEAAAASLTELLEELATPERTLVVTLHDVVRAMAGPRRLVVLSAGRIALDTPIDTGSEAIAETYLGLLREEARR
ncbi:ABC transporter ATP-binding protein NatA [bacterium HR12]|nr:ABC transporter ATP-binding protein NatA [bacterium HR12]GIU98784.1 MAG: ABC transporter ATP-binding protein [Actinomycetota bacterium]